MGVTGLDFDIHELTVAIYNDIFRTGFQKTELAKKHLAICSKCQKQILSKINKQKEEKEKQKAFSFMSD